ncbi:MAG TPA: DUF4124 domain-containing protein [Burkholderiales bacterium]|nr:DUF4124 domain-containing protein [Burkholderiales bacterium]
MKTAIALALLIATLPVHAQLLKCVGNDGRVEYASQCPAGTDAQQTGIRNTPAGPAAGAAVKQPTITEQEADFRKRRAEQAESQDKQQKEAAEKAQRQRACQDARNYLVGLESGARIARTDPNTGERVFLEDAARAQELINARQSVQANCK